MRYVPAGQLQPGMVLGQGLHDASGRMLLAPNTSLTNENITYIKFLGTAGVYIDDEITRDIQVTDVVRPEVKSEAVSMIQQFFAVRQRMWNWMQRSAWYAWWLRMS